MENDLTRFLELARLNCQHFEVLLDYYVDGELPDVLLARFEDHLKQCPDCEELAVDIRRIVEVARTLSRETIPTAVRDRLRRRLREEASSRGRNR